MPSYWSQLHTLIFMTVSSLLWHYCVGNILSTEGQKHINTKWKHYQPHRCCWEMNKGAAKSCGKSCRNWRRSRFCHTHIYGSQVFSFRVKHSIVVLHKAGSYLLPQRLVHHPVSPCNTHWEDGIDGSERQNENTDTLVKNANKNKNKQLTTSLFISSMHPIGWLKENGMNHFLWPRVPRSQPSWTLGDLSSVSVYIQVHFILEPV